MKTKLSLFALLALLGLLTLNACAPQTASLPPQAITLHALDISFDTKTLEVKAGQPVELTYINEGLIDHAFSIDGFIDNEPVKPGKTRVFTFTPTKPGTYKFYCAMPGHEMAGMVGTLTVTP